MLHRQGDLGSGEVRLRLFDDATQGFECLTMSIHHGAYTWIEGHAAEVRSGGLVNKALLPALTDYALMREELSTPGRDPSFEGALAAAAKLALS